MENPESTPTRPTIAVDTKNNLRLGIILGPILLLVIVLTVFSIYAPGRYGGFVLDDFGNIGPMSQIDQGVDGLVRYVFSGTYGTQDRWLSKLSFFLDSPGWPSDAYRFKQNNILFHILNGLLVIWVFLCLMRCLGHSEKVSLAVSLILGTLWLLHPLNTSTALYVVQRMTELAGFFVLLGLLLYLKGRQHLSTRPRQGYILMSTGLIGGTVLGFISKENAALLPLFALVLESTLFNKLEVTSNFRIWKLLFLYFPLAALLAWLAYQTPAYLNMDQYRPYGLWERLMSESRALMDYLRLILIPTRAGTGVFHDDFIISRGLMDPPTTLVSIAAIAALIGAAVKFRSKYSVYTFGIAWFFVGHILESTVVPLELYFEHRNYIPMLGPLFALCYYLFTTESRVSMFLRGSLIVFTGLAAASTWQNVYVWTNTSANLEIWEKEHPTSPRMLEYAANIYSKLGQHDAAVARLQKLRAIKPEWASPELKTITMSCQSGKNLLSRSVDEIIHDLDKVQYDTVSVQIITNLLNGRRKAPCEVLKMEHIGRMVNQLIVNPNYNKNILELGNLYSLRGKFNGHIGNHHQAALDFNESYRFHKNHYVAIAESQVWAALGEYDKALDAVRKAKANQKISLQGFRLDFDLGELDQWENVLLQLVKAEQ